MPRAVPIAPVRALAGAAISVAALWIVLSRLDLASVAGILRTANVWLIVVGVGLVASEVLVRAWRWRVLLSGLGAVSFRPALAYLCIGYFANGIFPVRLGDVVRAYLAGTRLGLRRLGTLGTILVERLVDGSIMLVTVLVGSLVLPVPSWIRDGALFLSVAVVTGTALILAARPAARTLALRGSRFIGRVIDGVERLAAGARSLRRRSSVAAFAAASLAGFALSTLVVATCAAAVGLSLGPVEAVFIAAGLALSLSIPAAPSSLGTYELAGVALLGALGHTPEQSFAAVLLTHAVASVPPTVAGAAYAWSYHVRLRSAAMLASPDAEEPVRPRDPTVSDA